MTQRIAISTASQLDLVVQGQQDRSILQQSKKTYLSKCKVMTEIMLKFPDLREETFICSDGSPKLHTGLASKVYMLKLPMTEKIAKYLFAAISIDDNLPKNKRRRLNEEVAQVNNLVEGDNNGSEDAEENDQREEDDGEDDDDTIVGGGNDTTHISDSTPSAAAQSNIGIATEAELDPGRDKLTVSAQTFQNYKSALKWWHEYDNPAMDKVGFIWPADVNVAISKAIATYKRDVGNKKRKGIMKQKEGKSPYNLKGYVEICKFFANLRPVKNMYTWNEGIFAGLFTKLSVNTIGRSDNIDDLLFSNINWENDAMTIRFGTTKADQSGEKTSDVKRIFANPFMPEVCAILQTAIFIWCCGIQNGNDGRFLFPGPDQNKRYYNALKIAVKTIAKDIDLGARRDDIGTHSNRKFAESTSVSKIDGPSRTQVCLRAGQGVGRTQDCYMFSEDDGDALVGRTVAQLKLTADEFDVLPPHFGPETLKELEEYGWGRILIDYDKYPESFQRVVPYLFAQIVYHWQKGHLARLLPSDHPLFQQPVFTDRALINRLDGKVILLHGYCPETLMSAQGVPGIILISRELRNFRAEYDNTCEKFANGLISVKKSIEELNVDMHDNLPSIIVEAILKNFTINGVAPINMHDIRAVIKQMMEAEDGIHGKILKSLSEIEATQKVILGKGGSTTISNDTNNGSTSDEQLILSLNARGITYDERSKLYWHLWGGRFHIVPEGFKFPSYNTRTIWYLWFFGRATDFVSPYRRIDTRFDLSSDTCRSNFFRTKRIIERLVRICICHNKIKHAKDITLDTHVELFEFSYPLLICELYPVGNLPERSFDININTLANRMRL